MAVFFRARRRLQIQKRFFVRHIRRALFPFVVLAFFAEHADRFKCNRSRFGCGGLCGILFYSFDRPVQNENRLSACADFTHGGFFGCFELWHNSPCQTGQTAFFNRRTKRSFVAARIPLYIFGTRQNSAFNAQCRAPFIGRSFGLRVPHTSAAFAPHARIGIRILFCRRKCRSVSAAHVVGSSF